MKTWFTSDNHFGHANIIKYSNRPFTSVQDMDESMIRLWNEHVSFEDTVYMLGDVAFMKYERIASIMNRLNGVKHLIFGNHDKEIQSNMYNENIRNAFKSFSTYKEITLEKRRLILCHYAMRVWNQSHHGSYMLFGHTHGTLPPYGRSVDVGVDSSFITGKAEYRPFSWEEVDRFLSKQPVIGFGDK